MSNRLTTVRDALQQLLHAAQSASADSHRLPSSTATALLAGIGVATRALRSTAFTAPIAYPCHVETRDGGQVTLVARLGDQLVGLRHEDSGLDAATWNLDGSYFGSDDPSADDLVLPELNPGTLPVPA